MRVRTHFIPIGLSAVLLFSATSCLLVAGAAVGAGAYAYIDGELKGDLAATPQRIVKESVAVLEGMDMSIVSQDASAIDGRVEAKSALDKKITITVKAKNDTTSTIGVRVGTIPDKDLSQKILDKIKARL